MIYLQVKNQSSKFYSGQVCVFLLRMIMGYLTSENVKITLLNLFYRKILNSL